MLKTILIKSKSNLFMKLIIILMISLMQVTMLAQSGGSIAGKIIDKNTNEELIGANVLVEGTTIGA